MFIHNKIVGRNLNAENQRVSEIKNSKFIIQN